MNGHRSPARGPVEYIHQHWPADPEHAPQVRAALRLWLSSLHLDGEEIAEILLAAAEAVDNAVRHAYPAGEHGVVDVRFWTEPGTLHIDVADHGHWRDTRDGEIGRGMTLMRSFVESVVINMGRNGTCVSLRQPLPRELPTVESGPPAQRGPKHALRREAEKPSAQND